MDTLAFGYILPTTGRIRDFNPLETCAARRTYKTPRDLSSFGVFSEVPDGFEPPIRELQSHALPLGYGTIFN